MPACVRDGAMRGLAAAAAAAAQPRWMPPDCSLATALLCCAVSSVVFSSVVFSVVFCHVPFSVCHDPRYAANYGEDEKYEPGEH